MAEMLRADNNLQMMPASQAVAGLIGCAGPHRMRSASLDEVKQKYNSFKHNIFFGLKM